MRRWLSNLALLASFAVLTPTALLWLTHGVRREFDFGLRDRKRLGSHVLVTAGNEISARPYAGYGLEIERPWPRVRGPVYLTPADAEWEKQFRDRDRRFEFLGLRCWRWAIMSSSTTAPEYTEFRGYWYGVEAPYWLVCAISAPLPIRWLLRRRRHRRRTAAGRCPTCGYDLRATPERCPECGAEVSGRLPDAELVG